MLHLQGECPICKKNLQQDDDVVTCPYCGAAYHRECYSTQGRCSFEEKHGSGFVYKVKAANEPVHREDSTKTEGGKLCAACSTVNDTDNVFCENCGMPLRTVQRAQAQSSHTYTSAPAGGAPPPEFSGDIDGIAQKDWQSYIGQSAPIYMMRLNQLKQTGRKVSFIASAFLFTPLYFAYRKMWGWAAIALTITLLLLVPQIVFIAASDGVMLLPGVTLQTLSVVDTVTFYISTFVRLMFALYAMNIYRKSAAKHIQIIRKNEDNEDEVQSALVRKGGVSVLGVVGAVALIAAFYGVAYMLIGDSLLNMLYLPFY